MSLKALEVDVDAQAAYPTDPQFTCLSSSVLRVTLSSTTDDAYMSVTGTTTDEVHLVPNTPSANQVFFCLYTKVWLRRGGGASGSAVNVQVTAEN